jgi:hypothetical protein
MTLSAADRPVAKQHGDEAPIRLVGIVHLQLASRDVLHLVTL